MDIEMVIKLDQATGGITVSGPIDNKLLSYGMLEMAKEAVSNHHAAKTKSGLVPIRGALNGNGAN